MKDKIREILLANIDELDGVDITDDLELITGGYIDSFDIIGLISEFEDAFDISIPLEDLEVGQFDTVNSIENVIRKFQN
jgi:acyl carrier protein